MRTQNYATHRHVPRPTIIAFAFWVVGIVGLAMRWFAIGGRLAFAVGLGGLAAATFVLIGISREYTTRLQDRIIKLEMRARCATLLTPAQHAIYSRLTKPQIVALRFASDEELPSLLERADREHLTANQIKQAIKEWVADWDRT